MASVPARQTFFPGAVANPAGSASHAPVWAMTVLLYLLFLPPQFNLDVSGIILSPSRLYLAVGMFFVLRAIGSGRLKLIAIDYWMLLFLAWILVALSVTTGIADAFNSLGAQGLDTVAAYFFARMTITSFQDFRRLLVMIAPGLFLVAALIATESLSHTEFVQPIAASITGQGVRTVFDVRLGLLRSRGPFPHPILAGIFLGSFLTLYWLSGIRGWPRLFGIVSAFCAIFSLSSAAMLALLAGSALTFYNFLTERFTQLSWKLWLMVAGILAFAMEFGTNSGVFSILARYAALNSASSYNRILIWRYGSESVRNHPWFGIGFEEMQRPSWMKASIDNYWLLVTIQFGLVATIALFLAVLLCLLSLGKRSGDANPLDRRFLHGITISLAVFAFGIFSVSIWLSAQVWFFALLGIATTLGIQKGRR